MAAKTSPAFVGMPERHPESAEHKARILSQLDELMLSPPFRTSKRCQALLSYVVHETLADRADRLKERTIGVDVFGRELSYDTNHDAVVRNAAAEVRKRLAQFYVGHEEGVRIDLPLGSYVPVFVNPPAGLPPALQETVFKRQRKSGGYTKIAAAAGLLVLASLLIVWRMFPPAGERAIDKFWKPVLSEREAVQICVGQPIRLYSFAGARFRELQKMMDQNAAGQVNLNEMEDVGQRYLWLGDAEATLQLSALLQSKGKTYRQRIGSQTSYADLRGSPVVLIGAFNNEWTISMTGDLRFYFFKDAKAGTNSVLDRKNPSDRRWTIWNSVPRAKLTEDYALITRHADPATGRTVVSVAGITDYGTLAAAEFITDPHYLEKYISRGSENWSKKNVQIVLKTPIESGAPGPPMVEATYFWN